MTDHNPYLPPDPDAAPTSGVQLASLASRFTGALIDGLIELMIMLPIMSESGYWEKAMAGEQSYLSTVLIALLGFVLFVVIQGYFLANYGQTIGKKLVGTRIVSIHDNKILPFTQLLALRYVPLRLIGLIPLLGVVGGLINVLYIFRPDRRCVHDLIAGSKVIKA